MGDGHRLKCQTKESEEMTKTIAVFAAFVFTALMYVLPVLITCAFLLHWNRYITLFLLVCGFIQFVGAASMAYVIAEGEFDE